MSSQALMGGVAQSVGNNVTNAALSTPQGQAAVAATAALVVAAAPVVAVAAVATGVFLGTIKLCEWLESL